MAASVNLLIHVGIQASPVLSPMTSIGIAAFVATVDSAPAASLPDLESTLLVQGQPLPVVLAVMGVLLLATLAIRRFSLHLGAPAILGVLLFGLLLPDQLELFQQATIANLHTVGLAMLLFFAGLQTELRSIRGFLEYGVVLAIGGVVVSSGLLGLLMWGGSSVMGSGLELGFSQIPLSVAMLIAACSWLHRCRCHPERAGAGARPDAGAVAQPVGV